MKSQEGPKFLGGFHVPYDQRDMIDIFNHFDPPLFPEKAKIELPYGKGVLNSEVQFEKAREEQYTKGSDR